MITLEHRCRLLLRAYPVEYRKDRGEEIMGTLLDATPADRSWPLARDVTGLLIGGLRVRAELNRRLTTAANLRVAAFIGVTTYLAYIAVGDLSFVVLELTRWTGHAHMTPWPPLIVWALVGAAVAAAWASRRKMLVLTAVVAASVALVVATTLLHGSVIFSVPELACVASLALFAGRTERPSLQWLWPVALVAAWPLAQYLVPGFWTLSTLIVVLPALSLLWVVIDARPAVAAAVFVLGLWLPAGLASVMAGPDIAAAVPLLIVSVVAAFAVWLLHRQSAHVTARRES
jgi:hypothetical protein